MTFDIHIATEGTQNAALKQKLVALGFKDDDMAERHVTFDKKTGLFYTSCPLIGIHMSRKFATSDCRPVFAVAKQLERLMNTVGAKETGYLHAEREWQDTVINPASKRFNPQVPFPCGYLKSRPRAKNKKWDIHIAIKKNELPKSLKDMLMSHGFYFIVLWKTREGKREQHVIFTIQGVSNAKDGLELFKRMQDWFMAAGGPRVEMKLEVTNVMKRFNNPMVVPPTVTEVKFR